jgi:hypothetical protein
MQLCHPQSLREAFPFSAPKNPKEQLSSFWVEGWIEISQFLLMDFYPNHQYVQEL